MLFAKAAELTQVHAIAWIVVGMMFLFGIIFGLISCFVKDKDQRKQADSCCAGCMILAFWGAVIMACVCFL